jgi:hypothetical protein
MTHHKTTEEIQQLLRDSNMDFDSVVNDALNAYLPKIFLICPITSELCIGKKQCMSCESHMPMANST